MRICEANTRILRANFRLKTDAMLSNLSLPCAASTEPQTRGESNSVQGAGVKKTLRQRRVGRAFPMAAQAESASRSPHSDWDVVSGWHIKRKLHPGIDARNGIHFPEDASSGKFIPESALRTGRAFPTAVQTESASQNPRSDRDALSASPAASKNLRALHPKTG